MRQLSIILLTSLIMIFSFLPAFSAVKGGIDYSISPDYSKLSEQELELKALESYYLAMQYNGSDVNNDITNALTLYSVLLNINPQNTDYCIKSGELYDKIGKDKYAKGNFSRAVSINPSNPEPYFYLGGFYYKRGMYRKALRYYLTSYGCGNTAHYETLYKIGDIYEKFGDTRQALNYLHKAAEHDSDAELNAKIKRLEAKDAANKLYYVDR